MINYWNYLYTLRKINIGANLSKWKIKAAALVFNLSASGQGRLNYEQWTLTSIFFV